MATITANSDSTVITPELVLDYAYSSESRNVVLEPLGGPGYPTVFLRPASSRAGTLSLLFATASAARAAHATLTKADRFAFAEPAVGEEFEFVVTGPVTNTHQAGTTVWVVAAPVREVEPL